MDKGTEVLKKVADEFNNMSVDEYEELYEEALEDIESFDNASVPERFKGAVCKTVAVKSTEGSNPSRSSMDRIFKYHLALYALYKEFSNKIFYGKQAEQVTSNIIDMNFILILSKLEQKKLIRTPGKNECLVQFKDYDGRRHYRVLTFEGLKIGKEIENNPKLITKYLLTRGN